VLAVPRGRVRLDLSGRELVRERLDLALVGAQIEVHRASIRLSFYDMSVIASTTYLLYSSHGQRRPPTRRPASGGSHPGRAGPSGRPLSVCNRPVGERPRPAQPRDSARADSGLPT